MLPESLTAAPEAPAAADLSSCAKEPIRTPGMIQPHGLLLVIEEAALVVRQASVNSLELVNIPPQDLVDRPLEALLGASQYAHLKLILRGDKQIRTNPLKLRLPDQPGGRMFNVLVHSVDSALIFEAEPIDEEDMGDFHALYQELRSATARFQTTEGEEALCQAAADEVRRIIGYDRVMVYRLDSDFSGVVVAESQEDHLASSYLGLHFPASDIPAQARQLYTVNRLRCIPNANYKPATLFRGKHAASDPPLDMSQCVLRSVSPLHLEYLQNMGVGASMSVSLLKEGNLWGLIACHHYQPKSVCPERRLTCSLIGQIIESNLDIRDDNAILAYRVQASATQVRFLDLLARSWSLDGLAQDPASVLDFVDSHGAALVHGFACTLLGQTPDKSQIAGLIQFLTASLEQGVYATDSLSASYPMAQAFKDTASGMLAVEISRERGDYILWFRPEQIRQVNWAGNPDKPVNLENGMARLHPRKSFELWKEAVTLHSKPWRPCEVAAVTELRKTFRNAIAGEQEYRALEQKVRERTAELNKANNELDEEAAERKILEGQLVQAQKLESIGQLAAGIAHEVNTPIQYIGDNCLFLKNSFAELHQVLGWHIQLRDLAKSVSGDSELAGNLERCLADVDTAFLMTEIPKAIEQSLEGVERVAGIVSAMKEFSHPGSEEKAPVDLNRAIQNTLAVCRNEVKYAAKVFTDLDPLLPQVPCLAGEINQVILNLVVNAAHAIGSSRSTKDGELGTIRVSTRLDGAFVEIRVQDDGCGVRESIRHRIFDPFFTTKEVGKGTGQGLAIARNAIVKKHGGTLTFQTEENVGTTFIVRIPVEPAVESPL